jgi:hypothetical protein
MKLTFGRPCCAADKIQQKIACREQILHARQGRRYLTLWKVERTRITSFLSRKSGPMPSGRFVPFAEPAGPRSLAADAPYQIVQVGRDRELLHLRGRIISAAGYSVVSLAPSEATEEIPRARDATVWLFCHTLEFYELSPLAVSIRRRRRHDKLLRLAGLDDVGLPPGVFDGLLDPLEGVDDLLQMVASLAKQATVG